MSQRELLWLYRNLPEEFEELKARESAKLKKFAHKAANHGVLGNQPLDEILKKAIQQFGHLTDEELTEYKFSHGHCVTSRY